MRLDLAIVDARRELAQPVGAAADGVAQHLVAHGAHVDEAIDAALAQTRGRDRADAPQRVHRQLLEKDARRARARSPSTRPASSRRTRFSRGTCSAPRPADAVSPVASRIAAFSRCATDLAQRFPPGVLGHVEVRLVERQRLDQRRHGAEDLEHRVATPRDSARSRTGRRSAAGRGGRHAPSEWRTGRRTCAPRNWPPRRPRAGWDRRRPRPVCRAAPACRAAPPTRRTRPCRCAGCGGSVSRSVSPGDDVNDRAAARGSLDARQALRDPIEAGPHQRLQRAAACGREGDTRRGWRRLIDHAVVPWLASARKTIRDIRHTRGDGAGPVPRIPRRGRQYVEPRSARARAATFADRRSTRVEERRAPTRRPPTPCASATRRWAPAGAAARPVRRIDAPASARQRDDRCARTRDTPRRLETRVLPKRIPAGR